MPTDEILTLEIEPPYIGSAVSPTVEIAETTDDITVTITDFRGEHSYTVEKTDQAIEDAEQAAQNANDTAQNVAQGWTIKLAEINGTLAQQREQMGSAARAESERVTAENSRVNAENERAQEWDELSTDATAAIDAANAAAGQATTAAQGATSATNAANDATTRANNTITGITQTANQVFAQAGQATIDANAAAQSATDAATLATTKAGLADTAAQNADTATTAANNAANAATTAAEQADAAREAIQDDLAAKADKDGYYQQLTAGLADTLMSGDSETVQFAQRTSGRDGMARVESLRGCTVGWNQLYNISNTGETINGVEFSPNGTSLIANGTATDNINKSVTANKVVRIRENHRYLFRCCPSGGSSTTYRATLTSYAVTGNPIDVGDGVFFNGRSNGSTVCVILIASGATVTNLVFTPQLFDLTTMFGAGNEPATVEEFEWMFPEDYYPYDAGSLLSVNIEGIQSAGTTRDIPASTYFPDGLMSANGIYDELDFINHKATTRVGSFEIDTSMSGVSVDAPSGEPNSHGLYNIALTFTAAAWSAHGFNALLFPNNYNITNTLTSLLGTSSRSDFSVATVPGLAFNKANRKLYYRSTAPVTESEFLALINTGNNNKLTAALATPTETDLPENLQATYPVEIGGTESIVIPTGEQSAPPMMASVYAYGADGIRDETQSIVAPVERGTASSNYSVGSYLVMGGILYRVTTAIATGEIINPGTNCTATTVMDEIVRLTT